MKNKRAVFSKSSVKKNIPIQREKVEPGFERLITDAGQSKKAAVEILKWYTNSN